MIVTGTSFVNLTHQLAEAERVPGLRTAEYPGVFSVETEAELRSNIEKMTFDRIIDALTQPVDNSGVSPATGSNPEEIVFAGTLEEVNAFFSDREWSDGLPIIPPTLEKVREFLEYTDRPPHEKIPILPPANLAATPWSIAVNGAMAGCQPKHMPILMAAAQAISDPRYDLDQFGTTAGLNAFLLINGPLIQQLGIKCGTGLASLEPNRAIGRALGLIIRNIADLRPARQYMGTFGYILPFVLAEDEVGSPWEPFHVEHGFDRNTSTVTAGGTFNWGFQAFPSGTDAEGLLKIMCREIVKHVNLFNMTIHGHEAMMTVVMTPSVAQVIAHGGYSKQDAEKYLFENSRATIREVNLELKYGDGEGSGTTIREVIEKGWDTPKEWGDLGPDDTITVMPYPGLISIVVCGDPNRNKAMALWAVYSKPATREIKLPADWHNS